MDKDIQSKHSEHLCNVMEDEVVEQARLLIARDGELCGCDICVYNVSAITLNNLKPHYITTNRGELFARVGKLNVMERTQVTIEILRAIEIVRNKKMHD
jgi:competence protein ComFB